MSSNPKICMSNTHFWLDIACWLAVIWSPVCTVIVKCIKLSSSSENQMNYENKSQRKISTRRLHNLQAQPIIWRGVYELDGGHICGGTLQQPCFPDSYISIIINFGTFFRFNHTDVTNEWTITKQKYKIKKNWFSVKCSKYFAPW